MTGRTPPPGGEDIVVDVASPVEANGRRSSSPSTTSYWLEARLFLELAGTTTLLNLGFFMAPFLTASYVGRLFGPVHLSGFALANLTGNLCTFSVMAGLFSASDTLSPQAFGAGDYAEVGYVAMRGVVAAVVALLPINIFLVLFLEPCLVLLGQDPEAARLAVSWYRVFVLALPFSVVFTAASKFLSAQHVMRPLIVVSVLCTGVVLPLGLEVCTELMGFLGSAMCYVLVQASQATLLLCYLWWKEPHDVRTWPGFGSWRGVTKWRPMMEYLHLGAGGILAQSEWVFWEALGLVVGMVGVVEMSAHAIANQTIMAFIQVSSLGRQNEFPFSHGTESCVFL
jgi:multidrug resistance protein, MATE family